MASHILWVRYISIREVSLWSTQAAYHLSGAANGRQLSSFLLEERVGWYMNLITPIRSPHWPLRLTPLSSSSIFPLWYSSSSSLPLPSSLTPLYFLTFSHQLQRIKTGRISLISQKASDPDRLPSCSLSTGFSILLSFFPFSTPLVHTNVSGGFCQWADDVW